MKEFQGQRRRRRIIYSWPIRFLFVLVIILLASSVYRLYTKWRRLGADERAASSEVADLEARRAALEDEVARLGTDRGLEEAIRENLNVVRPGEKVITFVSPPGTTTASRSPDNSWWREIIDWFRQK